MPHRSLIMLHTHGSGEVEVGSMVVHEALIRYG